MNQFFREIDDFVSSKEALLMGRPSMLRSNRMSNNNKIAFGLSLALVILTGTACQSKDRFMGAPPTTTDPVVGQVSGTSAMVVWTTSEPMSAEIQYGPDTLYGTVAGSGGSAVTSHAVTLTGLAPSSLYHFRVKNHSNAGETLYSYDRTIQTPAVGVTLPLSGNYGFDNDVQSWVPQTYQDSRAVRSVTHTGSPVDIGPGALRLDVDLRVGHPELGKGETYVEFKNLSPVGVPMGFIDLDLVEISAQVFAPAGARGDPNAPNGVQLFVIDTEGRSEYGPYVSITEGAWFEVTFSPASGDYAFTTPGFDSTKVALIGVKLGTGGGSVGPDYAGPIYVDTVGF